MAVYTTVNLTEIQPVLKQLQLPATSLTPIQGGMDNSNFFLQTSQGEYVLTLFESLHPEEVAFFGRLLQQLKGQGLPVASPLCDPKGQWLFQLHQKPLALAPRLPGAHISKPNPSQCYQVGAALANLHNLEYMPEEICPVPACSSGWDASFLAIKCLLQPAQTQLLEQTLQQYHSQHDTLESLPRGIIHSDLFRDNTLFDGDRLTGLLDFYSASNDIYLFDLAVAVNDWCHITLHDMNRDNYRAIIKGYCQLRRVNHVEKACWPILLKVAAMTYWLFRIEAGAQHHDALRPHKDPGEYHDILSFHWQQTLTL